MDRNNTAPGSMRTKAVHEFREFVVLVLYLYVAFGALTLFKFGILREQGIEWAPWGLAVIKALLVAKFILIARALHVGDRFETKPLVWQTPYGSVVILAFVFILTVIEEAVVGLLHDRGIWQSVSSIGGGNSVELVATLVIMFLIFLPYFAFRSLGDVMGDTILFREFFVERQKLDIAKS